MKTFNVPVIDIVKLNISDVITTSSVCPAYDPACPSNVCPDD